MDEQVQITVKEYFRNIDVGDDVMLMLRDKAVVSGCHFGGEVNIWPISDDWAFTDNYCEGEIFVKGEPFKTFSRQLKTPQLFTGNSFSKKRRA